MSVYIKKIKTKTTTRTLRRRRDAFYLFYRLRFYFSNLVLFFFLRGVAVGRDADGVAGTTGTNDGFENTNGVL